MGELKLYHPADPAGVQFGQCSLELPTPEVVVVVSSGNCGISNR